MRLQTSGCLAIPDTLLHIPLPCQQPPQQQQLQQQAHAHQLSGLLLVGSRSSSSQVVGLPQGLSSVFDTVWSPSNQQQQQPVLPILQSALLPSLAGRQAATVYKDPSGMSGPCIAAAL